MLLLGLAAKAGDWTVESPKTAVVWAFDRGCVDLKSDEGQMIRVKRSALKDLPLDPKKTKIEYFPESLQKQECPG